MAGSRVWMLVADFKFWTLADNLRFLIPVADFKFGL